MTNMCGSDAVPNDYYNDKDDKDDKDDNDDAN